jgi:hypothetical protein
MSSARNARVDRQNPRRRNGNLNVATIRISPIFTLLRRFVRVMSTTTTETGGSQSRGRLVEIWVSAKGINSDCNGRCRPVVLKFLASLPRPRWTEGLRTKSFRRPPCAGDSVLAGKLTRIDPSPLISFHDAVEIASVFPTIDININDFAVDHPGRGSGPRSVFPIAKLILERSHTRSPWS